MSRCEHGSDGVFNGEVGLSGDLCQRLKVRHTHLDHETAHAGLAPLAVAPCSTRPNRRRWLPDSGSGGPDGCQTV